MIFVARSTWLTSEAKLTMIATDKHDAAKLTERRTVTFSVTSSYFQLDTESVSVLCLVQLRQPIVIWGHENVSDTQRVPLSHAKLRG